MRVLEQPRGVQPAFASAATMVEPGELVSTPTPLPELQPIVPPVTHPRMPVLFLAHGSPFLLDDIEWKTELGMWAANLPKPKSILMVSAHWEERPATLGATRAVPLVYDFYGFPEKYYQVQYDAPGAPELARRVRELLAAARIPCADSERGLDHGAWVPLVAMYSRADIPVLQLSLPSLEPRELFEVGQALATLRDEGVLIVGSGFLTHNLRALDMRPAPATPAWASDFDAWAAEALQKRDLDLLLDYRARAPGVQLALPTHEHFVPLFVSLGAAEGGDELKFPIGGWNFGSMTKRSVQFG